MSKHQRQDGFTLLEVLLSITILAISMTLILQLFGGGLRLKGDTRGYDRVMQFAHLKMQELLLQDLRQTPTLEGGQDEAYRWQVEVVALEDNAEYEAQEGTEKRPLLKFKISLRVFWNEETRPKQMDLHTIALYPNEGPLFES